MLERNAFVVLTWHLASSKGFVMAILWGEYIHYTTNVSVVLHDIHNVQDALPASVFTGAGLSRTPTVVVATTLASLTPGVPSTVCTGTDVCISPTVMSIGVGVAGTWGGGGIALLKVLSQNPLGTFLAGGIPRKPLPPILSKGFALPPT
jgi:hypothetical protein